MLATMVNELASRLDGQVETRQRVPARRRQTRLDEREVNPL